MKVEDMRDGAERLIAIVVAVCGALTGAALMVGFYAAFERDRLTFWIWIAALAVLMPADLLLSRLTGVLSMAKMTKMYASSGLPRPRARARLAVSFARFVIPVLVTAFLYAQVWGAVVSLSLRYPTAPIAALLVAACASLAYLYAFLKSTP